MFIQTSKSKEENIISYLAARSGETGDSLGIKS